MEEGSHFIEMAFPVFEKESHWEPAIERMDCYLVNNLRKQRVEINLKQVTEDELKLIIGAKALEIQEFIKEKVVEKLKQH